MWKWWWPLTWSRARPVRRKASSCARISAASCRRAAGEKKMRSPWRTGSDGKRPSGATRAGMRSGGRVGRPSTKVRCSPTPSRGMARVRATASAAAGSPTMRLAQVRIPCRWARSTASLTASSSPKSSAVTMRRLGKRAPMPADPGSSRARPRERPERQAASASDQGAVLGDGEDLPAPDDAAADIARHPDGEAEGIAQRHQPSMCRTTLLQAAMDEAPQSESQDEQRQHQEPRRSAGPQRAETGHDRQRMGHDAAEMADGLRRADGSRPAQLAPHERAEILGDDGPGDGAAQHDAIAAGGDELAQHVIVRELICERLEPADPLERGAAQRRHRSEAGFDGPQSARDQRLGEVPIIDEEGAERIGDARFGQAAIGTGDGADRAIGEHLRDAPQELRAFDLDVAVGDDEQVVLRLRHHVDEVRDLAVAAMRAVVGDEPAVAIRELAHQPADDERRLVIRGGEAANELHAGVVLDAERAEALVKPRLVAAERLQHSERRRVGWQPGSAGGAESPHAPDREGEISQAGDAEDGASAIDRRGERTSHSPLPDDAGRPLRLAFVLLGTNDRSRIARRCDCQYLWG